LTTGKTDYAELISAETNMPYKNVQERIDELQEAIGLMPSEFYEKELYTKSRTQQYITGSTIVRKRRKREALYKILQKTVD